MSENFKGFRSMGRNKVPIDNLVTEEIFTDSDKLISYLTQLAVNKNNIFRGYGKQSE